MVFEANKENITKDNPRKTEVFYCDAEGRPVFKARELLKGKSKINAFPYGANRTTGEITTRKISLIEFNGWDDFDDVPKDFHNGSRFGLFSPALKVVLQNVYPVAPNIEKLIVNRSGRSRFSKKTVTLSWEQLERILKTIKTETSYFNKNRKQLINNRLSTVSKKYTYKERALYSGELSNFLSKFDSADKVSDKDLNALTGLVDKLPLSKISVTSNFIQTKEKINIAFLEDIISKFESLQTAKSDNEEAWQQFFNENSWIFSHLFPFEVILRSSKAYIGGKTVDNSDGKIVDFLFKMVSLTILLCLR